MSTTANPGFEISYHEPTNQHWLYVPAGTDPKDGAPLTWARHATPFEVALWGKGQLEELAALLAAQGVPVAKVPPQPRPRSRWGRLLVRLFGNRG
jgi:hypothetical protein